uniref:Uncharacterized protein n=1 Tax=Anguilla anguilla TaxID=7936 RepID=A0A0E9Q1W3_ANGAN
MRLIPLIEHFAVCISVTGLAGFFQCGLTAITIHITSVCSGIFLI